MAVKVRILPSARGEDAAVQDDRGIAGGSDLGSGPAELDAHGVHTAGQRGSGNGGLGFGEEEVGSQGESRAGELDPVEVEGVGQVDHRRSGVGPRRGRE